MKKNLFFYAALYIRLSREDGDKEESDSVGNQRKLLLDYIERQAEIMIADIYIDDGYSGTNFERPEFKRLIRDVEAGKINCVIVKDLSRFGRDYIDAGRYLERFFPEMGVRFIAVSDGIDSMKQAYDMMLPIKNIFNEQYARDISKKIQATVKTKQQAGEFIGSFASYGYKKSPVDKNKLVIDAYPAGIVKRIFDMYISGIGKQRIARILTEEGILCPSAYKQLNGERYRNTHYKENTYWTYSTINSILHKEMYIGNMVQGTRHQSMRGRQNRVAKEDWIIVSKTHEPIIDRETWDKAQRLLKRRTRQLDLASGRNIFAGFIRCGDCDAAMVRVSWSRGDGTKKESFYCGTYKRYGRKYCTPHTLPLELLEQIILDDLKKIIQSIKDLEALVKQRSVNQKEGAQGRIQEQISKADGELAKIRKWKQSLYEDYKEGILSKEDYMAYREDYANKENRLLQQMESMRQLAAGGEREILESPWVRRLLQLREIEKLDRLTIVEMLDKILVYDNRRIRITYNFSNELEKLFETQMRK